MTHIARADVAKENRWNVEELYPSLESWNKELETIHSFQDIALHKGKLSESPEFLLTTLMRSFDTERKLRKLYTYAHLRHDEDLAEEPYKIAFSRIMSLYHQFGQETAWIQPEILSMSEEQLQAIIANPLMKDVAFFLEKLLRLKKHTLSAEQEEVIALAEQALETSKRAFSAINNADFRFGDIKDASDQTRTLTHASYGLYIRDQDRVLRKNAFTTMHSQYATYQNTLAELLSGQVQNHLFNAKVRNYSSCLEAALQPKNIDTQVYRALIEAVRQKLPSLHRYLKLRKQLLDLPELHYYDLYVPLVPAVEMKFDYDQAEQLVIESVKPLGDEYASLLHKGLKTDRWVDRYENQNKRSGAYSSGCYDSMPYILMNYKGILRDVFTLAHEAGHSMHSLFSRQTQPYHYSDYTIFVAEVASTFNEELLTQSLLKQCSNPQEKAFLINEKIEDIRATLFRQTMFAEFELAIHEAAEKRQPLTPQFLSATFADLNKIYFGNEVIFDQEIAIEWARIPHFYYNFYVFQYATGISAALALAERVVHGNKKDRDAYLQFLRSGSSDYPLRLLEKAGVAMNTAQPVLEAIGKFDLLVSELESLLAVSARKC